MDGLKERPKLRFQKLWGKQLVKKEKQFKVFQLSLGKKLPSHKTTVKQIDSKIIKKVKEEQSKGQIFVVPVFVPNTSFFFSY